MKPMDWRDECAPRNRMRYVSVGKDATEVAAIGVGCMGLGGYFNIDHSTDAETAANLRAAFDLGMTFVDTAEVYAAGHSEELVGQAIAGRRNEIYLATKVSPEHLKYADVISAAENSLKRLRVDCIDLYQVHWPNPTIPIDETMSALAHLVRAGKIRHIGLSNFSLKELKTAAACLGGETIAAVQVEYNLFDRSIEQTLLPYCREHGVAVIGYSPLDQGHICGGPRRRAALEEIGRRYGCSAAQLALAWLIRQPGVLVIPKAAKLTHAQANAAAARFEIDDEDAAAIDRLTAYAPVEVPVDRIRVVPDDAEQRKVYRTAEEARANIYGAAPSPLELAREMQAGEMLKTVRVRAFSDPEGRYDYDLIEGRIRYWGWVLAFNGERPIPVLVRE